MSSETFSEIKNEFSRLHKLLDTYRVLLGQVRTKDPTDIELLALAGILQSFYSAMAEKWIQCQTDILAAAKR